MKMLVGDIILIQKENHYHDWIMWDFSERRNYRQSTIEVGERYKELSPLKYGNFKKGIEVIKLIFDSKCRDIHLQLDKLNMSNRILLIEIQNKFQTEDVMKLKHYLEDDTKLKKIPILNSYKEKKDTITNIIKSWELKYNPKDMEGLLIDLMLRNEDLWTTVRETMLLYKENKRRIDKDILEGIFPNIDFYSLKDVLYSILEGKTKWKNFLKFDYFLTDREYSASWMLKMLQEEVLMISTIYSLYRRGILQHPIEPVYLTKRIEKSGIKNMPVNFEVNMFQQKRYLEYISKVPYSDFIKIVNAVFSKKENCTSADLYSIIEEIKIINSRKDDGDK